MRFTTHCEGLLTDCSCFMAQFTIFNLTMQWNSQCPQNRMSKAIPQNWELHALFCPTCEADDQNKVTVCLSFDIRMNKHKLTNF